MKATSDSVLFVTLDSCRYDTFLASHAPAMKSVSDLYKAQAPSHFTYGSHAAMFIGFTPGVAELNRGFVNPKFGRLFRLSRVGWPGHAQAGFELEGSDIIHGFRNAGYRTIGSAAMGWFDPETPASKTLIEGFDYFNFTGLSGVKTQISWIESKISENIKSKSFVFLNIGETHVPYYYENAPWSALENTCKPFSDTNDETKCRDRQIKCCEFVDQQIAALLDKFSDATILICADHGDCWGEDGLWEHGISHPMTLTVPLLIRVRGVKI